MAMENATLMDIFPFINSLYIHTVHCSSSRPPFRGFALPAMLNWKPPYYRSNIPVVYPIYGNPMNPPFIHLWRGKRLQFPINFLMFSLQGGAPQLQVGL